jgi:hypothetical protein
MHRENLKIWTYDYSLISVYNKRKGKATENKKIPKKR